MTTKEKILAAALELFNSAGTEKITVRHIASRVGISHGNLCYHFQRKEDIITALYLNLVEEMNSHMASSMQLQSFDLDLICRVIRMAFKTLYKYKFLLVELVSITRKIPELRDHFSGLEKRRREEFRKVFNLLIFADYIKQPVEEKQLNIFVQQLFLISNFWISESEIMFQGSEDEKIDHYSKLALALLIPMVTEEGLSELKNYVY